jgi:hypothetical protein
MKAKPRDWHTFRLKNIPNLHAKGKVMRLDEIFNQPSFRQKQTVTFPFTQESYNDFAANGWPEFETKGAHWLTKGRLKVCKGCDLISRNLVQAGRGRYAPWVCTACYSKFDFSF